MFAIALWDRKEKRDSPATAMASSRWTTPARATASLLAPKQKRSPPNLSSDANRQVGAYWNISPSRTSFHPPTLLEDIHILGRHYALPLRLSPQHSTSSRLDYRFREPIIPASNRHRLGLHRLFKQAVNRQLVSDVVNSAVTSVAVWTAGPPPRSLHNPFQTSKPLTAVSTSVQLLGHRVGFYLSALGGSHVGPF